MPVVSVRSDVDRFARTLDDLGRQQLPFAVSLAINRTAKAAKADLTRQLPEIFRKKGEATPFTKRAIGTTVARKSELRAEVFVKRIQAKYLAVEETGGPVTPGSKGNPILTPVDLKTNQYGNIPRGKIKALIASDPKRYFLATIRGIYGLWERTGKAGLKGGEARGLRLLVAFRNRADYKPKFGFAPRVAKAVEAVFVPNLEAAMAQAIRTAISKPTPGF